MNTDQETIQSAYGDAIRDLYANLFQGYTEAGHDAVQKRQAEENFTAGVGMARSSRDRAIALLA
jgi:hypothetical protein